MDWGQVVRVKLRERQLAGDARAGSWARARARREQREFLRRNWRLTGGFSTLTLLFGILVSIAVPDVFVQGIVIGVTCTAVPALLWSWTVQVTGTGPVMMGDHAEQWSAQEMRKLRRHGWRLVNHFALGRDDIDHVLLGPGGIWVVETKWSSSWNNRYAHKRVRDAADQAILNARRVGLWGPIRKRNVQVRPIVVLWGGGWSTVRAANALAGQVDVPVVPGRSLTSWLASTPSGVLTAGGVDDVWGVLDNQTRGRDAFDQETEPMPLSFASYLARGFGVFAGFAASVLAVAEIWVAAVGAWTWVLSVAVTLPMLPIIVVLKHPLLLGLRLFAWGWIGGVGLMLVSALVLYAQQLST